MIKRTLLLLVVIAAVLFLSFRPAEGWQIYTSDLGHYAISFPGNPLEHSEFDTTEDNLPFAVHFLSFSQADTVVYILGWIDMNKFYPASKTMTQVLNDCKDDATKPIYATNVVVVNTSLGRYPYIEFTFKTSSNIGKERIYLINKFKYSVIAMRPIATGVTPDMDRFIGSFLYLP